MLLALADSADDDGYCWPKRETIAAKARLKERQVINALAQLTDDGELAYLPGAGRGHLSMYVILCGLGPEDRAQRVQGLQGKAAETLQRLQGFRDKKAQRLHPSPQERVQSAQRKGAIAIGDSGVSSEDDALIRHEIRHDSESPPPPAMPIMEPPCAPAAPAGGGGGPSASASAIGRNRPAQALPGAIYLAQEGFSNTAVRAWGHVAVDLLRADIERRRRDLHQQNGGIVLAWRTAPPDAPPPAPDTDRTPNTDLAARLRVALGQPQPEDCSAAPPARAAEADSALRMAWQLAQLELSHADRQWLLGSHIGRDGPTVVLVARSSECCSAIERTLAERLRRVLREHLGGATQLRVTAHTLRNGATA